MPGVTAPVPALGKFTRIAAVALAACGPATAQTPVVTAIVEPGRLPPGVDPFTPEERLMALLTADNPGIERVAMSLSTMGDATTRKEAGQRIASLARAVLSKRWRPDGAGEEEVSDLEEARTRALEPFFSAMSHVGGPAVVAFAFIVAEDVAAPRERRLLALRVLSRTIPPGDEAAIDRRAFITAHLPPEPVAVRPVDVALALQRAARACFHRTLSKDPDLGPVQARITLRFARNGTVESAVEGNAPEDLRVCLVRSANGLRATAGVELAPSLVIPFSFVKQ